MEKDKQIEEQKVIITNSRSELLESLKKIEVFKASITEKDTEISK